MPRGGKRPGAGRKPTPKKSSILSKGTAGEILEHIALDKNPHGAKCRCLACRWRTLSTAHDLRLRYQVEKSLLDRVLGLPPQTVEHSGGTDENGERKPIEVRIAFVKANG